MCCRLSPHHWGAILSHYNESLAGRHVAVLPPLLLSQRVAPERAAALRHPDERDPPPLRWQALAAALDPIDMLPGTPLNKQIFYSIHPYFFSLRLTVGTLVSDRLIRLGLPYAGYYKTIQNKVSHNP